MRTLPRQTVTQGATATTQPACAAVDLNGEPVTAAPSAPLTTTPAAAAHDSDPQLAAALFAAWSGDRFVCVASPPGAGKTRLITHLADQLHRRAGLNVAVAAQTRAQALDVANRAAAVSAAALGTSWSPLSTSATTSASSVSLLGKGTIRPLDLAPEASHITASGLRNHNGIVVATTARWQWTDSRAWTADVLLIDEAWQLTYSDLLALGPLAPQIVCVGDPGQISPVVTGSTRRWDTWDAGPQTPAPDALSAVYGDEVTHQRLPQTWRLGPQTTALLQPVFYADLPFTSARPDRWLETPTGPHTTRRLPELDPLTVATTAGHHDAALPAAAAARVRELLHATVQAPQDGTRRLLTAHDVAVITPHVGQASAVAAHLADLPGVLISTANAAQGLEREAVVVLHPLAGYRSTPEFATDPGRLCVALSRHRAHATVLYDPNTRALLTKALREDPHNTHLNAHLHVLAGLGC